MYWDTVNSNTIDISDAPHYAMFEHMKATTPEGYRCDPLQSTPVLFLGSCDMNGPIEDTNQVWSKLIYDSIADKHSPFSYIALGKVHISFISIVRRLYAFCKQFGPPKRIYMTMPRPLALEIPMYNGVLVNMAERNGLSKYLLKCNMISNDEFQMLEKTVAFVKSQENNADYHRYQFEHAAAFLETICARYNIELRWTPNLSISAIAYWAKYLPMLLEENSFMLSSCVGMALAEDFTFDGSMNLASQHQICKILTRPKIDVTIGNVTSIANQNLAFVEAAHAKKLVFSRGD